MARQGFIVKKCDDCGSADGVKEYWFENVKGKWSKMWCKDCATAYRKRVVETFEMINEISKIAEDIHGTLKAHFAKQDSPKPSFLRRLKLKLLRKQTLL